MEKCANFKKFSESAEGLLQESTDIYHLNEMNLSMGSHSFDVNRWIQCFEQLGVIKGWQFLKENSKTQGYNLQDFKNIMAGLDSQEITSGTSSRRYINERIINSESDR
ncbi:hypothetical protein ACS7ZS_000195 [Enterococcus hirae]